MKVSGIGATTTTTSRKVGKSGKAAEGSFARQLGGTEAAAAAEEASAVDSPVVVAGIEALLVAQAVGDTTEQETRQRMVRRGDDILDRLDELRHGLLIGAIPKERLIALAQLVRSRRDAVADPRLASILDEIELRAEVELAKLSRRSA